MNQGKKKEKKGKGIENLSLNDPKLYPASLDEIEGKPGKEKPVQISKGGVPKKGKKKE